MALVISDRVKETTTTTGTGTYTLGGAVTGFETFTTNLSNSDTTYYCCTDNTDFEVGLGTFTSSGTTLARTAILASSNSNNAVSWSSGTRTVFCTLPAAKTVFLDASGNTSVSGSVTATSFVIGSADINENDLESIDGITAGTVAASKAAIVDTNKDITGFRNITLTGELDAATGDFSGNVDVDGTLNVQGETTLQTHLNLGDSDKIKVGAAGDLEIYHDGSDSYIDEVGTGDLIIRANDDLYINRYNTTERMIHCNVGGPVALYHDNSIKLATASGGISVTGEVAATSLDISGDADIDGTLEADAITVNGTALNTVIAGTTVTTATNANHVSVADNENTNEENLIPFIEDASATGNVGLESDGDFAYNPSTGTVSATIFKGNIDAVDGDFDGTLEADAITLNGTAVTATATLSTGISNTNVAQFGSGVVDDDFLRVNGTTIEGRSASEVLSDIGATTAALAADEATALAIALG
jgi:cytoskeletal protein CcmA (bactofilin family)